MTLQEIFQLTEAHIPTKYAPYWLFFANVVVPKEKYFPLARRGKNWHEQEVATQDARRLALFFRYHMRGLTCAYLGRRVWYRASRRDLNFRGSGADQVIIEALCAVLKDEYPMEDFDKYARKDAKRNW